MDDTHMWNLRRILVELLDHARDLFHHIFRRGDRHGRGAGIGHGNDFLPFLDPRRLAVGGSSIGCRTGRCRSRGKPAETTSTKPTESASAKAAARSAKPNRGLAATRVSLSGKQAGQ